MESDGTDLFDTGGLSFESTLDSLMDDYLGEATGLQLAPPLSEALMSAQLNDGEDLGSNKGGNLQTHVQAASHKCPLNNLDKTGTGLQKTVEEHSTDVFTDAHLVTLETAQIEYVKDAIGTEGFSVVQKSDGMKSTEAQASDENSKRRKSANGKSTDTPKQSRKEHGRKKVKQSESVACADGSVKTQSKSKSKPDNKGSATIQEPKVKKSESVDHVDVSPRPQTKPDNKSNNIQEQKVKHSESVAHADYSYKPRTKPDKKSSVSKQESKVKQSESMALVDVSTKPDKKGSVSIQEPKVKRSESVAHTDVSPKPQTKSKTKPDKKSGVSKHESKVKQSETVALVDVSPKSETKPQTRPDKKGSINIQEPKVKQSESMDHTDVSPKPQSKSKTKPENKDRINIQEPKVKLSESVAQTDVSPKPQTMSKSKPDNKGNVTQQEVKVKLSESVACTDVAPKPQSTSKTKPDNEGSSHRQELKVKPSETVACVDVSPKPQTKPDKKGSGNIQEPKVKQPETVPRVDVSVRPQTKPHSKPDSKGSVTRKEPKVKPSESVASKSQTTPDNKGSVTKQEPKVKQSDTVACADVSANSKDNSQTKPDNKCNVTIQEQINLAELKEKRMKNLAQKRKNKDESEEISEIQVKRRKDEKSQSRSGSKSAEKTVHSKSSNDLQMNGQSLVKSVKENLGDKVVSDSPTPMETAVSSGLSEKSNGDAAPEKSVAVSIPKKCAVLVSEEPSPKSPSSVSALPLIACTNKQTSMLGDPMEVCVEIKKDVPSESVTDLIQTSSDQVAQSMSREKSVDHEGSESFSSYDEANVDIIDKIETESDMNENNDDDDADTIVETTGEMYENDIANDDDFNMDEDQMNSVEDDLYDQCLKRLGADSDANSNVDEDPIPGPDEYDSDLDDNEIYDWLEEGLKKEEVKVEETNDKQDDVELKEGQFMSREKIILEVKGESPFEVLPEGWVQIAHNSGMPVYLHRQSRVITLSRPYFIGTTSVRKHDILLSAIPCLHYKRQLEKEEREAQDENAAEKVEPVTKAADGTIIPTAILKSAEKLVSVAPEELHDYCKKLFKFKTMTVKTFKTWREKRSHFTEQRKKEVQLPGLPSDTKLITCMLPTDSTKPTTHKKKEFVLNPVGKTPVCILHEYTQHVLRVQPTYVFKEIENAEKPFKASIHINGIQYGSGVASAKRLAKAEAAKATLEMFMPWLAAQWKDKETEANNRYRDEQNSDLSYFEEVLIDDPRVTDLCDKAALPKPVQVLHECLKRNFGLGDTSVHIDKKMISNQRTEFSLTVGKHTATVVCKNKREGKQRAAQAMLKLLHPHLKNWASILRLYSKSSMLGFKEREEEAATSQEQVSKLKNYEILDKLKDAMRKLKAQRASAPPPAPGNIHSSTQPIDL